MITAGKTLFLSALLGIGLSARCTDSHVLRSLSNCRWPIHIRRKLHNLLYPLPRALPYHPANGRGIPMWLTRSMAGSSPRAPTATSSPARCLPGMVGKTPNGRIIRNSVKYEGFSPEGFE